MTTTAMKKDNQKNRRPIKMAALFCFWTMSTTLFARAENTNSSKKRMVWWQDNRGNYSFEIDKCWEKEVVGKIPSYQPTSDCPASQTGGWKMSLAYKGLFAMKKNSQFPKEKGWFDFGSAGLEGFQELDLNGRKLYFKRNEGNPSARIWVAVIFCDIRLVTLDQLTHSQIDPMFTETLTAKSNEKSPKVPDVFVQFVKSIQCEQQAAEKIDESKRNGAGTIAEMK